MGNLWKINALQNYTTRDEFTKLTFKKGDSFSARVLRLDGDTKDVVIKLLDGRVFPALVEGNITEEKLENYLFKFQLSGFSGGKLALSILEANLIDRLGNGNNLAPRDLLMEELLKNLDFPISKEDVPILKTMLKNNIELTENNLMEIKGLNEIVEKVNSESKEIHSFIDKFIEAKGLNANDIDGKNVKETIENVFKELKGLKYDDVIVMKSLGIKLTEEDIRAFAKITSMDYNVLAEVKEAKEYTNNGISIKNSFEGIIKGEELSTTIKGMEKATEEITFGKVVDAKENTGSSNKININEHSYINTSSDESTIGKAEVEETLKSLGKSQDENVAKKELMYKGNPIVLIKEDIKEKISIIKEDILTMLKAEEKNPSIFATLAHNIESKFQEFKMYNTLNSDYYMLNIPINVKEDEYGCKLIIKDDRGKGKKLDSQNIKIAASVDTIHMDKIDAYITVNKNTASINIESYERYVKILEKFKGKLIEDLSTCKYMFNISIKEKKEEFSFGNCRTFFEDDDFTTINTHV